MTGAGSNIKQLGEIVAIDANTGADAALASAGAQIDVASTSISRFLVGFAIDGDDSPGAQGSTTLKFVDCGMLVKTLAGTFSD